MNQTAVKNHFWGVWFDDRLLMWNYWFINRTTVADHFISGANWAEIYSLSSYLSFGTHKHICLESSRHLRFYNVFFRLVEHDSSTNSKQRDILHSFCILSFSDLSIKCYYSLCVTQSFVLLKLFKFKWTFSICSMFKPCSSVSKYFS